MDLNSLIFAVENRAYHIEQDADTNHLDWANRFALIQPLIHQAMVDAYHAGQADRTTEIEIGWPA